MNETLYWICLAGIFGQANPNLWKLMHSCESAEEGYRMITEGRFQLSSGEKKQFMLSAPEKSAEIINICRQKNIKILTYNEAEYPSKLKNIFNPPAVLYASGDFECLNDEMTLSVVGTREPSGYGRNAAFRISEELSRVGFTIVSGFAAGIDSAAHRGALSAGGKTIAVLGCGVDIDYPKANSDIREEIMNNGVIVSEFPPGTQPFGKNFPLRNRIISGLSLGVFVAEAPLSSGALITADSAVEQGRDVFCLPPSDIFSRSYQGVVKYLRDGAVPVFSHLDIIYEYYTNFSHKLSAVKPSDEYIAARSDSVIYSGDVHKTDKKSEPVSVKRTYTMPDADLTEIQKKIAVTLLNGPLHVEEISSITETDMSSVLCELTEMELSGAVVSLPGKMYSL